MIMVCGLTCFLTMMIISPSIPITNITNVEIYDFTSNVQMSSNKLKTYICLNPYMEKDINSLFSEFINELEYKKNLHTLN